MRRYIDFRQGRKSADIRLMFPGWERGETVAFLSPHDDDALLGAGYLIDAVLANLGDPVSIRSSLVYSVWGDFAPYHRLLDVAEED